MPIPMWSSSVSPESRRKRVLIVAYYFPPIGTSGTFRTLKFVKYLPQFGWDPVVLTVDARHEYIEPMNDQLLNQVPASVAVVRTYAWSAQQVYRRIKNRQIDLRGVPASSQCSLRQKVKRWIREVFIFPDRCCGWFLFAVAKGFVAARRYDVDVIYSSAPPYTGTLVGLVLSKLTGKPLVSDFRDPWAVNTYRASEDGQPTTRRERLAQRMERKTFSHSACNINISADLTAKARCSSPPYWWGKFETIHNGYDPDDFKVMPKRMADARFRVVYSGTFYEGSREPKNFLLALRHLADQQPEEFEKLDAWFVGDMTWVEANMSWYNSLKLGAHVQFKPFLPHKESLKLLAESDLLLMIGSIKKADTGTLPAKLFEYAALGRPMLGLVHEGESARFVRGYGLGRVANPEDPESIAAVLLEMVRDIRTGTFPTEPNMEFLRRYDRRELTRQLAEVFDSVISRKP